MGKKDSKTRQYFMNPEKFADLVNGVCFKGKQILKPEDLSDYDPHPGHRIRDVAKMASFGVGFVIIGEENQETVDYSLPVRIMESDLADYKRMTKSINDDIEAKIKAKDSSVAGLESGELLYRYPKDAKIKPVVTIVLSNAETWDGPEDLKDMLDIDGLPEEILPYISGYHLNIVDISGMDDDEVNRFRTDLRLVFEVLRCRKDKEKLKQVIEGNDEYAALQSDTYELIKEYTNLDKFIAGKSKGGQVDMRDAFDDIHDDGIREGRIEGRIEGEMLKLIEQICKKIARGQSVSEIAEDLVEEEKIVAEICDIAASHAPKYDTHKIYEEYKERNSAVAV